jgi:hypothetical protein
VQNVRAGASSSLQYSSHPFSKQSDGGNHMKGHLPTCRTLDRKVVVEWKPDEKSMLYVSGSIVVARMEGGC